MGKRLLFAGLPILAAVLSAGAIYWNQDGGPAVTATEGRSLSNGEEEATANAGRDALRDFSSGSMSRSLIEPAAELQAIRPGLREQPVATSKQEIPIDLQRTSAELALAPQANQTSSGGSPDVAFSDGPSADEVLVDLPEDANRFNSEAGDAAAPVATLQPATPPVDERRHAAIASATSAEANDADHADVDKWPAESDAVTAPATEGIDTVAEPPRSPPVDRNGETAGSRTSVPEPVSNGDDRDPSPLLASKPADLEHEVAPTEELNALEGPKQGQGSEVSEPSPAPFDDVIYAKRLLRLLGHAPGPAIGRTDPKTKEAILAFQKDHGRETTGEIDGELIAAMEGMLSESFRRSRATPPGNESQTPNVTQARHSTGNAAKAPPVNQSQRKMPAPSPADLTAKKAKPKAPTPEIAVSADQAKPKARERPVQEAALPEPSSRLQVPSEKAVEKAEAVVPNAFEACAATGRQQDYVKTETGFVLCEGLSFDARAGQ